MGFCAKCAVDGYCFDERCLGDEMVGLLSLNRM